jgi:hypothetical protein
MKAKDAFRIATRGATVITSARLLNNARKEGDKLKVADALLTLLSVAVTVAIIIREIRENNDEVDLT